MSGKTQLGKILVAQRLLSAADLETLLDEQRRSPGMRLASIAARSGRVAEVDLLRALSEQHGVPGIDLSQVVLPLANLRLVPSDVAKQYLILPFSMKDDELFLAMADPEDSRVLEEIEFVTGKTVAAYVALHTPLTQVIDEAYRMLDRGEQHYIGPNAPAEYLASLGLRAPARPAPPPTPAPRRPTAAPVTPPSRLPRDSIAVSPSVEMDFEPPSGSGARARRLPTLDPVFESRVAPLPKEDVARALRGPTSPRKVLVVDDEDDIRRMLRRVLAERGFAVIEAAKGTEALAAVREHMPDVIVLDAMLPEIHGFDICRRIKGSQKYGHIPIIMVSAIYRGWRFAEDLRESYGVEVFLEKPFKISEVVQAIERAMEGQPREDDGSDEDEQLSGQAQEALTSGMDAYKRGDLDAAILSLKQGVGIDPLSFRLHYHLGLLYGRRDNLFEAIHEMETAADLSPKNFAALKNLAVLYQRAGFKHKAIEIWERALGSAPDEETKKGIKDHLMSLL